MKAGKQGNLSVEFCVLLSVCFKPYSGPANRSFLVIGVSNINQTGKIYQFVPERKPSKILGLQFAIHVRWYL